MAAPDGLDVPTVDRFEDLRMLAVWVWTDGEYLRRVRFTNGRQEVQQVITLELWDFGVSTADLDWTRLPTFRSPNEEEAMEHSKGRDDTA